jgi:hypothetical protein
VRHSPPLERRLAGFHRRSVDQQLTAFSPLAGRQFKHDFNLSGFFTRLNALPDSPSSFWGIDRCLRIDEAVDGYRSRLFHMGVFARAVDLEGRFSTPARDARFHALQRATLMQLLELFDHLGVDRARLQATCFGGATLGGHPDGRDRRLTRVYRLPPDQTSRRVLREAGLKVVELAAPAGIYILPEAGTLVGPRVEVFFDDLECATVIFPCFREHRGTLARINYLAAYAVGIERLMSAMTGRDFFECVPRYRGAMRILRRRLREAWSPLLRREVANIVFGVEALAALPDDLTPKQQRRVVAMKRDLKFYILNLGLSYSDVTSLYRWFASAAR